MVCQHIFLLRQHDTLAYFFHYSIMPCQHNIITTSCHISNLSTYHYVMSANNCHVSTPLELEFKYITKANLYD